MTRTLLYSECSPGSCLRHPPDCSTSCPPGSTARLDLPLEQMFTYMPVSHCRDMVAFRRTSDTISIFLCVFEWHVVISHPRPPFSHPGAHFHPQGAYVHQDLHPNVGEFRRVFGEFRRVLASFWRVLASNRRVMGE